MVVVDCVVTPHQDDSWTYTDNDDDDEINNHGQNNNNDDRDDTHLEGVGLVDRVMGRDTIVMLQHHPVYTLGTGSDESFVLSSSKPPNDDEIPSPSVPVIRMARGGEVTYHGPGQLTVYPILDLWNYQQDIHWYMRALEEATIRALIKCGIDLDSIERQDDVTGVWVENHKVAAVGIKCRKWITMHGVAINVEDCALSNFEGIVPCGLEGRKVGCFNQFLRSYNQRELTVHEFALIMAESLEEVFRINLVRIPTSSEIEIK